MRRIVAGLTAPLVLVASISCACGGAVLSSTGAVRHDGQNFLKQTEASGDDDHSDHDADHHGHEHGSACLHCSPASVPEGSSVTGLSASLARGFLAGSPSGFADGFAPQISRIPPGVIRDLPPPTRAPTLLGLGCALNI
jgi:hypothetical protein